MRRKEYKNNKKQIVINGKYKDLKFNEFPVIKDFQMILQYKGKHLGYHLYYYSPSLGYLANFPWWDHVDRDLKKIKIDDILCGTLDNIYNDVEQSWEIVIFKHKDFVYVLQSRNEGSKIFEQWFKVDKELYYKEWEKVLKQARELEE